MEKAADAFRTISEVADVLGTPAHVLRFWESRFPQIRPVKRAGGRRYYRPSDVALLSGIRRLLHDEGLTIRGVQKILREQGVRHVAGLSDSDAPQPDAFDAIAASRLAEEADMATVVDFAAPMEVAADPDPARGDREDDLMAAPQSSFDLFDEDDLAAASEEEPEELPEVWLPTLLRQVRRGALENRQAALLPLYTRLRALREQMGRGGRGQRP
jgi:DNA-binding transcriptional MerR regulator